MLLVSYIILVLRHQTAYCEDLPIRGLQPWYAGYYATMYRDTSTSTQAISSIDTCVCVLCTWYDVLEYYSFCVLVGAVL